MAARRPVRVFHLIKGLGRGGAEMLLPEGLRFADRDRFEYSYGYLLPFKNALTDALKEQGAPVFCFERESPMGMVTAIAAISSHLRRNTIDVVHCHMPTAGVLGRLAAYRPGVRVVYSEHNLQERFHPISRRLNALTWRFQDHVIAVSNEVAESIQSSIRSSVPVSVILNGVDVNRFRRDPEAGMDIRRILGISAGSPVIGTVAVFRAQKRLEDWIEAAGAIHRANPETRFIIVGDGPLRDEVNAAIQASHLHDAIHLVGLQSEVRPYLSAMDIFMMSSEFEGLPIALLEAMSMGCVPVCTSVGGIPEVIVAGQSGCLTKTRKPEQLAAAVSMLLNDESRMGRFAEEARTRIENDFSMQRMTREIEAVYDRVLAGRSDGRRISG